MMVTNYLYNSVLHFIESGFLSSQNQMLNFTANTEKIDNSMTMLGQYGLYAFAVIIIALGFAIILCIGLECNKIKNEDKPKSGKIINQFLIAGFLIVFNQSCSITNDVSEFGLNAIMAEDNRTCTVSNHCSVRKNDPFDMQNNRNATIVKGYMQYNSQTYCRCCGDRIEKRNY